MNKLGLLSLPTPSDVSCEIIRENYIHQGNSLDD